MKATAARASQPIGEARIGISGWRYEPWRGVFYPSDLPHRSELAFASRRFPTIELNGSFYSLQRPEHYASWYDETPNDFVFSVKGPRFITHMLKLRNVETALANFFASGLADLREKLGPFLWQLPPILAFDAERLERFFDLLPRDADQATRLARRHNDKVKGRVRIEYGAHRPFRHALEVRHPSFVDPAFVKLLRKHSIALVVADTAGKWPLAEDVTADFVYLRLHGDKKLYVSGYTNAALKQWATRIDCWRRGSEPRDARRIGSPVRSKRPRDAYCYFDNDAKVKAPRDAQRLIALLK